MTRRSSKFHHFCYLGTVASETGKAEKKWKAGVNKTCGKWRETSDVICDSKISLKLKVKICK